MKPLVFAIFGIVSLMLGIFFLVRALHLYKTGRRAERVLSSIQVFTIGIFLAVVAVFIPVYYTSKEFGDPYHIFRPLLIAIHNSLRVFILDGDFEIIVEALEDENDFLCACFSFYAAVLYVIAPVLTFGNVLSLFKNIRDEIRYKWNNKKKHYIMSELNVKSIALARSICRLQRDAVIVFADVYEQNKEEDYELLTQARDMNAICLKKDISYMDLLSKKGDVEIFLIGSDESENVSQAAKITSALNESNTKHNVKVFVFSSKPGATYIVDSIKYDNLLQHANEHDYAEDCFKLRRIDEKHQLIWNTVPKMKLFDLADRHGKKLSVLIAGFGSYGTEFFKMLVWYCQFEGYQLEINIFDKQSDGAKGEKRIESVLERSCPELLKMNRSTITGEAHYDIKIFSGVDVLSSELDKLLLYDGRDAKKMESAERLKATNLVFVSLGDDDINIDVSVHLRSVFDRLNGVKAKKGMSWAEERVEIYSVVYDDQKCRIMDRDEANNPDSNLLVNHKDVPYHIHFIGGMSSQFDYRNIYDAELEKSAYTHHRSWVAIEERIHDEWEARGARENIEAHDWYYSKEKTKEAAANARKVYEQYEYYRLSSISKELYQREIRRSQTLMAETTCLKDKLQTCECKNCVRRKRSEHMRWNAYTRVIGYSYNRTRSDRALLHDNLCPWSKLSKLDRLKD